jgi:uncharacterized cupredoxin-like copper-binding protein
VRAFLICAALGSCTAVFAHGDKPRGVPAHDDHGAAAHDDYRGAPTPFGIAADPRKAQRTVRVEMSDAMRFTPSQIEVRRGEIVRFVAVNKGKVLHEMVLGRLEDLKKHAELMRKHPGMEHDEAHGVHVAPGKSGEIGWRFTRPGTFYFGCLIPGHFEAGMVGRITVR